MEKSFSNFIGIDVAKEKIDIFSMSWSIHLTVENNEESLTKAVKKFAPAETLVVIENTGGYERTCIKTLLKLGFSIHRTDNNLVKHFLRSEGKAKNDKIDAKGLALYGKTKLEKLELYKPKDDEFDKMTQLSSYLYSLKETRAREKCRLQSPGFDLIEKSVESTIELLSKKIEEIEEELNKYSIKDEDSKVIFETVQEYKGIGEVTARVLALHLPELGKASKREISALGGLAPYDNQSGKKNGHFKVKCNGRGMLRSAFFMPTKAAIMHNKEIGKFFDRLMKSGKHYMTCVTACSRKILVQLNAMVKKKIAENEEKARKAAESAAGLAIAA
jgi:transposase